MLQAAGIMRTTPLSLPSKGYSFATWLRLEGGAAKGTSSLFSLLLRGAELKGVAAAFTGGRRTQCALCDPVLWCAVRAKHSTPQYLCAKQHLQSKGLDWRT